MKEQGNHTERGFLADKFEGAESTPSPELWQNLESRLQKENKRRRGGIFWWVLSGVLIAGISFGAWMISRDSDVIGPDQPEPITEQTTMKNRGPGTAQNSSIVKGKEKSVRNVVKEIDENGAESGHQTKRRKRLQKGQQETEKMPAAREEGQGHEPTIEELSMLKDSDQKTDQNGVQMMKYMPTLSFNYSTEESLRMASYDIPTSEKSQWSASLQLGVRGIAKRQGIRSFTFGTPPEESDYPITSATVFQSKATATVGENVIYTPPVSRPAYLATLEIERKLSNRFSLASGVWFSLETGYAYPGDDVWNYDYELKYRRAYYGIPLTLSYLFLNKKGISLSVDGGVLADLSGPIHVTQYGYENGQLKVKETLNYEGNNFINVNLAMSMEINLDQDWSISLNAGAQMNPEHVINSLSYFNKANFNPLIRAGVIRRF